MDSSKETNLTFTGDTRPHVGIGIAHGKPYNTGGTASPQGRSATYTDLVSLSAAGAVITVTVSGGGTNPNFSDATALLVAGDIVWVRNTAGTETDYTISSVSANTITCSAVIAGSLNGNGAAICIQPNRRIVIPGVAVEMDARCVMRGFTIDGTVIGLSPKTSCRFNPQQCFIRGGSIGINTSAGVVDSIDNQIVSIGAAGNTVVGNIAIFCQFTTHWGMLNSLFAGRSGQSTYSLYVLGRGSWVVNDCRFIGPIRLGNGSTIIQNGPIYITSSTISGDVANKSAYIDMRKGSTWYQAANIYLLEPAAAYGACSYNGIMGDESFWWQDPNDATLWGTININCPTGPLNYCFNWFQGEAGPILWGTVIVPATAGSYLTSAYYGARVLVYQHPTTFTSPAVNMTAYTAHGYAQMIVAPGGSGVYTGFVRFFYQTSGGKIWVNGVCDFATTGKIADLMDADTHLHFNQAITSRGTTQDWVATTNSKIIFGSNLTTVAKPGNTGLYTRSGAEIRINGTLTNGATTPVDASSVLQAKADAIGAYTATYNSGLIVA
jgi:hypothetical protein